MGRGHASFEEPGGCQEQGTGAGRRHPLCMLPGMLHIRNQVRVLQRRQRVGSAANHDQRVWLRHIGEGLLRDNRHRGIGRNLLDPLSHHHHIIADL